jgi:hypothetical protein
MNNDTKTFPALTVKTLLNPDAEANLRCRIKDLEYALHFYQIAIDDHRAGNLTEEECRRMREIYRRMSATQQT